MSFWGVANSANISPAHRPTLIQVGRVSQDYPRGLPQIFPQVYKVSQLTRSNQFFSFFFQVFRVGRVGWLGRSARTTLGVYPQFFSQVYKVKRGGRFSWVGQLTRSALEVYPNFLFPILQGRPSRLVGLALCMCRMWDVE